MVTSFKKDTSRALHKKGHISRNLWGGWRPPLSPSSGGPSLEMLSINCKLEVSLKWIENCVLTTVEIDANADATSADGATLEVSDAEVYVPVVTLSAERNVKLVKQLNEGFKRPVFSKKYKVIDNKVVEIAAANAEKHLRKLLDSSYHWVKRLFVLAYDDTAGDNQVSVILSKNIFFQELNWKLQHWNWWKKFLWSAN